MNGARVAPNGRVIDRITVNACYQDQLLPGMAFNGQNYLIAWADRRGGETQVYFTQVTTGGVVLNDTGTLLSGRDSSVFYTFPAIASNGGQYFAAWQAGRWTGDVALGARISASGEILDTIPFEFGSDTLLMEGVAAASDGQDYLVVWSSETPNEIGSDLYLRRVSASGAWLDSAPVLVARSPHRLYDPALAFGNGHYLAVWAGMAEEADIFGCRILPDGTVLDPGGFAVCADSGLQCEPAVGGTEDRFLVAWTDNRSGDCDIYAALVDSCGNVALAEAPRPASGQPMLEVFPAASRAEMLVRFRLPVTGAARLAMYDACGRLTRALADGLQSAGTHTVVWDGTDRLGHRTPSGAYFCRLSTARGALTRKLQRLSASQPAR